MIKEIHLAGAFDIPQIVLYNQTHHALDGWISLFKFWKYYPDLPVYDAVKRPPSPEAVLVVINLKNKVWDDIKAALPLYGRKILIQYEAYIGWEVAYQQCESFDVFINFDRTYSNHPGFIPLRYSYSSNFVSSGMDKRGFEAIRHQWHSSRRVFLDAYLLRFMPRHRKAVMIASLINQPHYQIRLQAAHQWQQIVDVFGKSWPPDKVSWRGTCGSKIDILRRYRYSLVMENQRQPGYISEKLLDAVAAETVPIYWGAPDIDDLPGHEAIIVIEDLNAPLEKYLADDGDYHRRKRILHLEKKRMLEYFCPEGFNQVLEKANIGK